MLRIICLITLLPALARATTAAELADEASRIQMKTHVHVEYLPELPSLRARRVPYVDVIPAGTLDRRLIYDRSAPEAGLGLTDKLGIVTSVEGETRLRIFLHPLDTHYRREIMSDLARAGDRVVGRGFITGYASASRSIFVPAGDEVVMLKMSTNDVNGFYQDKAMTLDDGVQSVLMSSFLSRELPGEITPEPLAVKISDRFSYVVRQFTQVDDRLKWVPGYAFGTTDVDSREFGHHRDDVIRRWARLTTRLNVFVQISFNHLQNILVGLDRKTGLVERVRLIDMNDVAPVSAELDGLRQAAGFDRSWPLALPPRAELSLNTFIGLRSEALAEPTMIRDRNLIADLRGLPADRVARLVDGAPFGENIAVIHCDGLLTAGVLPFGAREL